MNNSKRQEALQNLRETIEKTANGFKELYDAILPVIEMWKDTFLELPEKWHELITTETMSVESLLSNGEINGVVKDFVKFMKRYPGILMEWGYCEWTDQFIILDTRDNGPRLRWFTNNASKYFDIFFLFDWLRTRRTIKMKSEDVVSYFEERGILDD